jgi:hypothetical protein
MFFQNKKKSLNEFPTYFLDREAIFKERHILKTYSRDLAYGELEYKWYAVFIGFVIRLSLEFDLFAKESVSEEERKRLLEHLKTGLIGPAGLAQRFNYRIACQSIKQPFQAFFKLYTLPQHQLDRLESPFFDLHQYDLDLGMRDSDPKIWQHYPEFVEIFDDVFDQWRHVDPKQSTKKIIKHEVKIALIAGILVVAIKVGAHFYVDDISQFVLDVQMAMQDQLPPEQAKILMAQIDPTPWRDPTNIPSDFETSLALKTTLSDDAFLKQIDVLSLSSTDALKQSKDDRAQRRQLLLDLTDIVNTHDWMKLEYYEMEQRHKKSLLHSPTYYSEQFFVNMSTLGVHQPDMFEVLIRGWKQALQNDTVPYLAEAEFHFEQAFKRRGGAWAQETSAKSMDAFHSELRKASKALKGVEDLEGTPQHWYYYFLKSKIEFYAHGNRNSAIAVFLKGLQRFPSNIRLGQSLVFPLSARWYGNSDELYHYSEWYIRKTYNAQGFRGYLYLINEMTELENMKVATLRQNYAWIKWDWVKQGILEDLKNRTLTMEMLNFYAFLATICNKPKVAHVFFNKTKGLNWNYFESKERFQEWQTWAEVNAQ